MELSEHMKKYLRLEMAMREQRSSVAQACITWGIDARKLKNYARTGQPQSVGALIDALLYGKQRPVIKLSSYADVVKSVRNVEQQIFTAQCADEWPRPVRIIIVDGENCPPDPIIGTLERDYDIGVVVAAPRSFTMSKMISVAVGPRNLHLVPARTNCRDAADIATVFLCALIVGSSAEIAIDSSGIQSVPEPDVRVFAPPFFRIVTKDHFAVELQSQLDALGVECEIGPW
jgi:hypothetical protein